MPGLGAVLESNVLLSGIACPGSIAGTLLAAWRYGALEVVLSGCILDELRRLLPGLAHRHGLLYHEIDDLIDALAMSPDRGPVGAARPLSDSHTGGVLDRARQCLRQMSITGLASSPLYAAQPHSRRTITSPTTPEDEPQSLLP